MVVFHCTSSLQVQIWEVEKKWSLALSHCAMSSGKFKTGEHILQKALKHFLAIGMTQKKPLEEKVKCRIVGTVTD